MSPLISIIVRTKNEERWIAACLHRIQQQTLQNIEVVLVDNGSTDKTLERALAIMPNLVRVDVTKYLPGYALNEGIRVASGEYLVCLSSHCVPKETTWLENLWQNFPNEPKLAGVYGRQIPMHFTSRHDKRDLIVTFGLDRRVQYKDPFFHNANSMIPRAVWDKFPFDEETTNIEDRLWAKKVLDAGYHLVYEPEAPVYHHHGIHQNRNEQRLKNVIQIMEADTELPSSLDETNPFHPEHLNVAALIPVREEPNLSLEIQKRLMAMTIESAKAATLVNRIVVTTDSSRLAQQAQALGAEVPFIRPQELSEQQIPVVEVLRNTLEWYEQHDIFFDYLVTLEITHPFRPSDIVQRCLEEAINTGLKTIVAGNPEYRPCWWFDEEQYRRIDDYIHRRPEREPIHVGLPAICSVLTPDLLRQKQRLDEQVGIVELNDPLAAVEIRQTSDFEAMERLFALVRQPVQT